MYSIAIKTLTFFSEEMKQRVFFMKQFHNSLIFSAVGQILQ